MCPEDAVIQFVLDSQEPYERGSCLGGRRGYLGWKKWCEHRHLESNWTAMTSEHLKGRGGHGGWEEVFPYQNFFCRQYEINPTDLENVPSRSIQSAFLQFFAYATQLHVMQPAKIKVIITTNTVKAIFTAEANHNIWLAFSFYSVVFALRASFPPEAYLDNAALHRCVV